MQCPKCQYVRSHSDSAPRWQCPNCGIAYEKVRDGTAGNKAVEPLSYQVVESAGQELGRKVRRRNNFRNLRIFFLLLILFFVAMDALLSNARTTSWEKPLWVVVYPINAADGTVGRTEVDEYIQTLGTATYGEVERFLVDEVRRYDLPVSDPVDVRIGPVLNEVPPLPPLKGSMLDVMIWSLKMRYWSVVADTYEGPRPDIQVFVLYHQHEEGKRLQHSAALQKGMVSVVHASANKKLAGKNNVIIAHEMLHTLGASDKYDFSNNRPLYPLGYAEPEREPLHPQRYAEIMGGRIPISNSEWHMPRNLGQTQVGPATAAEIGWLEPE
ncbi:hypothetical protein ACFL2V_17715 [Pseudomonadota bacterium]